MNLGTYNKSVTALVTGVLGWAAVVISSDTKSITAPEWLGLAVAAATALGVYGVANTPAKRERGAVDAGSLAVGILVGLLFGWLLWKNGGI